MSATAASSTPKGKSDNAPTPSAPAKSEARPAPDADKKGSPAQTAAEKPVAATHTAVDTGKKDAKEAQATTSGASAAKSPHHASTGAAPAPVVPPSAAQPIPPAQQPQQAAAVPPPALTDVAGPVPVAAQASVVSMPMQACKKAGDCPSRICISGVCAVASGFEVQTVVPATASPASSAVPSAPLHRGPQTACSDPRCHLPADLKGLNGAEDELPPAGSSNAKLLSDAGIAGLVLALLFVVLFLLLVVPKIRSALKDKLADWKNKRDEASAGRELGNGSPDFGNEDASTFEKRNSKYASSFVSPGHISGSPLPTQQYARYFEEQQLGYSQYGQPNAAHEIVYMGDAEGQEKQEKDRAVSFAGPGARRKAISFADDLTKPTRIPMSQTDGALNSQRVPRETVLPYTVGFEDQTEALAELRGVASPLIRDGSNMLGPVTPTMPSGRGFGPETPDTAASPTTPGSAYSVRTSLLPASLQTRSKQAVMVPVHTIPRNPVPPLAYGAGNVRPGLQRLPSLKVTPSSMISEK